MSQPIHVRDARASDAATIVDFNARLARETEAIKLDRPTVQAGVDAVLGDSSKGRYFVAESGGRIIAQLMITHEWSDWRNGDIWWIQSVYVAAEHRRRGAFRALYEHAKSAAQLAGAVAMRLYVERQNDAAQQTYLRLGMKLSPYLVMGQTLGSPTSPSSGEQSPDAGEHRD